MFTLFKLNYVGLGFLLALSALSLPARADDLAQNLGPVGPHEPILATVGGKRVIAFYEPRSGQCGMHVVVWNSADASGTSAARVRVSLDPRQVVHIDSADNKSIDLKLRRLCRDALSHREQHFRDRDDPLARVQE